MVIYDIFGYFPQTIQGADILSGAGMGVDGKGREEYAVFMPDFFEGEACDIAWYPPVTDEQKEKLYAW